MADPAAGTTRPPLSRVAFDRDLALSLVEAGLAAAVFVVPFLAYATSILHIFYIRGSSFYDAGWYAYLIHDGGLSLDNPHYVGGSYFGIHLAPVFVVTSWLGAILPLTRIQFYAAYVGVAHALPGVAVFWLLVSGYRLTGWRGRSVAALLALLFSFDGLALAIAKFPHFVMLMVGAGAIFLVALVLRRYRVAAVFFVLCLLTREDSGFHLFGLLALAFLWQWRHGASRRELKPIAIFAAAALLYSTGAVLVQFLFLRDQTLLVSEYLGQPPFAGVTLSSVAVRLLGWLAYRRYVVFPAAAAIIWALVRRKPQIVLGYAAFLPWALLHLVAARGLLGTLPSYYAFPYVFAGLWPLVGFLVERRRPGGAGSLAEPLCGFALLTALSFTPAPLEHNPTHIALPADFVSPPSLARQRATDGALTQLIGAPQLGATIVDESVLALAPEAYPAAGVLAGRRTPTPDSVIYFVHGFQSALAEAAAQEAGLDRRYAVPGTAIRVASDRALAGIGGLRELGPRHATGPAP